MTKESMRRQRTVHKRRQTSKESNRKRRAAKRRHPMYMSVHGQDGTAEDYITEGSAGRLFVWKDGFLPASDENTTSVLGKDADSAFMDWLRCIMFLHRWTAWCRNFEIEDLCGRKPYLYWRLYGTVISIEDRKSIMGGYYKLNAYFYAPKDDQNIVQDQLYTKARAK